MILRLLSDLHKVREIRLKVFPLERTVQPLSPLEPVLVIGILDTSWSNQGLKTFEELLCLCECEVACVLNYLCNGD